MLHARKQAAKILVAQQKEILKSLFGTTGYATEWEAFILDLPGKKLKGLSQRAQFVYFLYLYLLEYAQKHDIPITHNQLNDRKAVCLAVLAELIICCQYYENYIFDGKNGVTTPDLIRKYLNAAANLKSFIFQYIRERFTDEFGTDERVRAGVDIIFNLTNVGQQMEADYNHYNTFKKGLKQVPDMGPEIENHIDYESLKSVKKILLKNFPVDHSKSIFFETYLKRLNLISAQLFVQFAKMLVDLIGIPTEKCRSIFKFANCFGYFAQLINDNIDVVELPTGSKPPQDAFSDFRNKNITLPIFFHLVKAEQSWINTRSAIRTLMESNHADGFIFEPKLIQIEGRYFKLIKPEFKKRIEKILIPIIRDLTAPRILNVCKYASRQLETDLKVTMLLGDMLTIAEENQFYYKIKIYKVGQLIEKKVSISTNIYSQLLHKWINLSTRKKNTDDMAEHKGIPNNSTLIPAPNI